MTTRTPQPRPGAQGPVDFTALAFAGEGEPEEAWGRSAGGQAYRRLRRAIVLCYIPPGQALSENELAGALGVSRTPVREALQRLADDGLVVVRPQQGTETSRISVHRAREAQFVRELLERSALALTFQRRPPLELGALHDQLARQQRAADEHDFGAFFASDQHFHRALTALSGFDGLARIAASARAHLDRARALSLPEPETMQQMVLEHRRLLEHVEAGHQTEADAVMRSHLRNVLVVLTQMSARFPGYFVPEQGPGETVELVALELTLHGPGAHAAPPPRGRRAAVTGSTSDDLSGQVPRPDGPRRR